MAIYRFGRGWQEDAIRADLAELATLAPNFDTPIEQMTRANGWTVDGSEALLGHESSGPPVPDGLFERAKRGVTNYDFSDPRIVTAHFAPAEPLAHRNMLLEMKVLGFHMLCGVRVHTVRQETDGKKTTFGFRYDTLSGHIERGTEWFLLMKDHDTGAVLFRIEAHWKMGEFPNWLFRLGFKLFGERFRVAWRNRAPLRLREVARHPVERLTPALGEVVHRPEKPVEPSE